MYCKTSWPQLVEKVKAIDWVSISYAPSRRDALRLYPYSPFPVASPITASNSTKKTLMPYSASIELSSWLLIDWLIKYRNTTSHTVSDNSEDKRSQGSANSVNERLALSAGIYSDLVIYSMTQRHTLEYCYHCRKEVGGFILLVRLVRLKVPAVITNGTGSTDSTTSTNSSTASVRSTVSNNHAVSTGGTDRTIRAGRLNVLSVLTGSISAASTGSTDRIESNRTTDSLVVLPVLTVLIELKALKVPHRWQQYQSTRVPERQSARAPECQSARAPEHQSARVPTIRNQVDDF